jgi:hypothetical protein
VPMEYVQHNQLNGSRQAANLHRDFLPVYVLQNIMRRVA